MQKPNMLPFFHPTTVVFVDDHHDFLASLALQLPDKLAYRCFSSPTDALSLINRQGRAKSLSHTVFSRWRYAEAPHAHHLIDINLQQIPRLAQRGDRFADVSTVVVDYEMPEMNGIEFCRRISNPAIRKIMLTGKADTALAVDAFNQGLIDRFIYKHDTRAMATLAAGIGDLQHRYFLEAESAVADALAASAHKFFYDPTVAMLFQQICSTREVAEYYVLVEPDGILMFDYDGRASALVVMSEQDLRTQYEVAFDEVAPADLLEALQSGNYVPYFWRQGVYTSEFANWQSYLYPATAFEGGETYYYAVVEESGAFDRYRVSPYRRYLDRLDAAGTL